MKTCATFFLLFLFTLAIGCDSHSSDTSKEENTKFDLGKTVNTSVKNHLSKSENPLKKLAAYSDHEGKVVDGVNAIVSDLPEEKPSTESFAHENIRLFNPKILKAFFDLIGDKTLPQLTDSFADVLKEIRHDDEATRAIADYLNTMNGSNLKSMVELVHRVFQYEKSQEFWNAFAQLLQKNPELLKQICFLLHQGLINLPEDANTAKMLQFLCTEVATVYEPMGRPVWMAKLDKNNNPLVLKNGDVLYAPFVDRDGDGVCDVNEKGKPVDEKGNVLKIEAFSDKNYVDGHGNTLVYRDGQKRAISPEGKFIFHYYDAKKTLFSVLTYQLSKGLRKHLPEDLYKFVSTGLLPKKSYVDHLGPYEGYSDEGFLFRTIIGALDLLKQQQARDLLVGLSNMIDKQNPNSLKEAFSSLGDMLWQELRDNPNIASKDDMKNWLMNFGMNPPPQIIPLFQLMSQTEVPGYPNMAMLFIFWVCSNSDSLADVLWPMTQSLREIKQAHPDDPQLEERLFKNGLEWLGWTFVYRVPQKIQGEVVNKPIASLFLSSVVLAFSENTEQKVEAIKLGMKTILTSRWFATFLKCLNNFCGYGVFEDALISFLSPQEEIVHDVYSELVRGAVGIMECDQNISTKVNLLKTVGKFFNPELSIVTSLLDSITRLIFADKELVFVQMLRGMFGKCPPYDLAPVSIFALAYIDVIRVGQPNPGSEQYTQDDVRQTFDNFQEFLTHPKGLLKRIYRAIDKNKK